MSLHRHAALSRWLSRWLTDNVTADQLQAADDWLLGRGSGDGRHDDHEATERVTVLASDARPPYHDYHRYRLQRCVGTGTDV